MWTKVGVKMLIDGQFNYGTGDFRFAVVKPSFPFASSADIAHMGEVVAHEITQFGRHALTNKTTGTVTTKANCYCPDTFVAPIVGTETARGCVIYLHSAADVDKKVVQVKNKGVDIPVTDDDMRVSFSGGIAMQVSIV